MEWLSTASRPKYARLLAAGCVALAAGGIVLLRADHPARAAHTVHIDDAHPNESGTRSEFSGPRMHGWAGVSQSRIAAGGSRDIYAEVRIQTDAIPASNDRPVAMAVVLDTSGSMDGPKIEQARSAVMELVDRMRDGDEIALVTYSDRQSLVQPLARVADVRARLHATIPTIAASGGTMIPQALDMGATALAGAPDEFVRRVVLVSDGEDNSGVALPSVEQSVRARAEAGVTLSSLGVGSEYDERFMTGVADAGRGNYRFLRDGSEMPGFLAQELQQASSTAIDRVVATVHAPDGWHLASAFGAEAQATGGTVRLPMGAIFASTQRRVVLRFSVDPGAVGDVGSLAVNVSYRDVPANHEVDIDGGALQVHTVATDGDALASRDLEIFGEGESATAAEQQTAAVEAWRAGDGARAQALAQQNVARLQAVAHAAPSAAVATQWREYAADSQTFGTTSAASASGRAYGLQSNANNRARAFSSTAY